MFTKKHWYGKSQNSWIKMMKLWADEQQATKLMDSVNPASFSLFHDVDIVNKGVPDITPKPISPKNLFQSKHGDSGA